jgi:signal peptidase I
MAHHEGTYTADPVTRRPALGCLFEVVETLVLTIVIFLVIQNFVAQPFQVKQQSMEQTLEPGQYVLVDKLTPRFTPYKIGDIVVFNPPAAWAEADGTPFIKRVIGLPGDTVEIKDDGFVYVDNGTGLEKLDEPYVFAEDGSPQQTIAPPGRSTWVLGSDQYFVLGDHRMNSADSRSFGPIQTKDIVGRAWLRYWPFSAFGILQRPNHPELQPATP